MPQPGDINPEGLRQLLRMEAEGHPDATRFLTQLRISGDTRIPPPIIPEMEIGRVNVSGRRQPRPQTPLPATQPIPDVNDWISTLDETGQAVGRWAQRVGKSVVEGFTDPEALGAVVGGAIGSLTPGVPFLGAVSGAGIGSSTVAAARHALQSIRQGKAPLASQSPDILRAGLTGAAAEVTGRMIPGIARARPTVDPLGERITQYFGPRHTAAYQQVESAPINFMTQIAKTGQGGSEYMRAFDRHQAQIIRDRIAAAGEKIVPLGPSPTLKAAGKSVTEDAAQQLVDAKRMFNAEYETFLATYGALKAPVRKNAAGEVIPSPTIAQYHKRRSAALERARRARERAVSGDPNAASFEKVARTEMKKAERNLRQMQKILPREAFDAYRDISARYNAEINRLTNPTISALKFGKFADDVIPAVLKGDLAYGIPRQGPKVAPSYDETIDVLQRSLTPKASDQLTIDVVTHVMNQATDPATGSLNFGQMKAALANLPEDAQIQLFGGLKPEIDKALDATSRMLANNQRLGGTAGAFFESLRQPAAAVAVGGGLIGGMGAAMGSGTARAAGFGTMATALSILGAPYIFSRLLTSPDAKWRAARKLLIQSAQPSPLGREAMTLLSRYLSQVIEEEASERMAETNTGEPSPSPEPLQ